VDFLLFLLLNGVLFIRPEELIPSIAGLQIYYWVICTNLIFCAPSILNQLDPKELSKNPITVCVLGVLVMIFLSHAAKSDFYSARMGAFEFLKVALYFLLLMAVVNTRERFLWFLTSLAVFTLAINTIAVLQYHDMIEIETLTTLMQNDTDEESGEVFKIARMRATGIFSDPNDLSMIIVASVMICGAGLFAPQLGIIRFALAAPISFLIYALTLTQSRGGLLALLAGCGTVFYLRYGWQKTLLAIAAAVPIILAVGGRQGDIVGAMAGGGTGSERAELWSEGIQMLKSSPFSGIGYRNFADQAGLVAHNSFIHSTAELGFFGGMFFLGVFAIPGAGLWQIYQHKRDFQDKTLQHLLPFVIALVVAYGVSMFSLSRNYVVPTYLIAGLATSYVRLAAPALAFKLPSFDGRLLRRLVAGQAAMIAFTYLFIKVSVRL
jgi:putative inorganic carbon (HCO3(-)) transporter